MVGTVFLSEGLLKVLFTADLGEGRFSRLGIPYPKPASYFVAICEITCSILILLGFRVRAAAWPLLAVMYPILATEGFWKAAHESRVDFCMICGLVYLLNSYWRRGAR
jgi:putative oxidoreductase